MFWDFDGVIKESVHLKTAAFVKLFEEYGTDIVEKIKAHHLANGGMSRFDKLPLYAKWVGKTLDQGQTDAYTKKFSKLVFEAVVNSDWVPGVEAYLRQNRYDQAFVLVSATPHDELMAILQALNLEDCFKLVYGAPLLKSTAISKSLSEFLVLPSECIMIGDACADLEAAQTNKIHFLLRRHEFNDGVFNTYSGPSIFNFCELCSE